MQPIKDLSPLKRAILAATGLLVLAGTYDAIKNLPIVSGCAFYGECQKESFRTPPGKLGRDVP